MSDDDLFNRANKVSRIDRAASRSTPASFSMMSYDASGFVNSCR